MTHVAPLLAAVLTSSLLRCAAADASIFCGWTKAVAGGDVHVTFLRRGSASPRLYHGVWSAGARRVLLGCSWSDDAAVVHGYLSRCRERAHDFADHPGGTIDLSSVLEEPGQCRSVAEHEERTGKRLARSAADPAAAPEMSEGQDEGGRRHQRVKRGFIVPGTLWCGSGNKAPSYEDLGVFADTDSCCREHDQCQHTILSFHSDFGVFNTNMFTMSHCDCDNRFRSCLMEAGDSISGVVGYTFFNLLKMRCFDFSHRLQCAQRNWFGMCKETKMALYAEVHAPALYETADPVEVSLTSNGSVAFNATRPAELRGGTASDPRLLSVTSAAPAASSTSSEIATPTVTPGRPAGSAAEVTGQQENTLPSRTQAPTQPDADLTERRRSCSVYKDLDRCRTKILPLQDGHGLHNPESRTLYHCNCTARLFQTLAQQRRPTDADALVLGRVSQSCFLLRDCTDGICTAVVVEAQRHLRAVQLKVRRPGGSSRAKRKDGGVKLHRLCLRTSRARRADARV